MIRNLNRYQQYGNHLTMTNKNRTLNQMMNQKNHLQSKKRDSLLRSQTMQSTSITTTQDSIHSQALVSLMSLLNSWRLNMPLLIFNQNLINVSIHVHSQKKKTTIYKLRCVNWKLSQPKLILTTQHTVYLITVLLPFLGNGDILPRCESEGFASNYVSSEFKLIR